MRRSQVQRYQADIPPRHDPHSGIKQEVCHPRRSDRGSECKVVQAIRDFRCDIAAFLYQHQGNVYVTGSFDRYSGFIRDGQFEIEFSMIEHAVC